MVYNLPAATGVDLAPDTVGALAREVDSIRYVKNTTENMAQSLQLISHHGDVISTFVGWDALILSALAGGGAGVMAGTGNVMSAKIVAVHDAVQAGNLKEARQAWDQIYPLIDAMMAQPYVPAVKAALAAVGFPADPPRAPLIALGSAAAASITELVSARPRPGSCRPGW
jgi:4-hydroxy-tetrahydrodipicolinate synthase